MNNKNVCIVGAGLVGSLWATILKNRGHDVTLFEKRSDIRKLKSSEDRSINLVITSRGLNGLSKANLLDEAIKLSVPILGRMIHARTGETQFQAYGKSDECNFSISRSELNKFLITAAEKAGVKIHFGHDIEEIDFKNKKVKFDKTEVTYDLLFGTDGAGSVVRRNLCKQFPSEYQDQTQWLEADYKELYMPAKKDGSYQVDKNALHIWARGSHMMMALANLDGSFTMTIYMPQTKLATIKDKEDAQKLFAEDFNDAIPLMPGYENDFVNRPQGKLGTIYCSKWVYEDSVVLMGDAAHAIVPFFGQGMNCGFEDCVNFLKILDENKNDWKKTIPEFEKVQKPNARAIAEMAIENWTEMRDKVGDARFLLRKKVEALLEKEFPEIYKARYGMVTYTMIPYATAQKIGKIHDIILEKICSEIQTIEEVSLPKAKELLKLHLTSEIIDKKLILETDPLVVKMRRSYL
jgi:kynurenine 3-monooxygenase